MSNKLGTMSKHLADNQVATAVQQAVNNVWSANMNILRVSRTEGSKVFVASVLTADAIAMRNVKALMSTAVAASDRANEAWTSVAGVFDARVLPVLDRVGLAAPAQFGVDLVGKGLAKVSARIADLARDDELAHRSSIARKAPTSRRAKRLVPKSKLTRRVAGKAA